MIDPSGPLLAALVQHGQSRYRADSNVAAPPVFTQPGILIGVALLGIAAQVLSPFLSVLFPGKTEIPLRPESQHKVFLASLRRELPEPQRSRSAALSALRQLLLMEVPYLLTRFVIGVPTPFLVKNIWCGCSCLASVFLYLRWRQQLRRLQVEVGPQGRDFEQRFLELYRADLGELPPLLPGAAPLGPRYRLRR